MKKNHFLVQIIIFILFLISGLLSNKVKATPLDPPLYFGLTALRSETNMGYAMGNPDSGAEKIWNIVQYTDNSYQYFTEANVYCIKADTGFTNTNKTDVYNVSYNMKTERQAIASKNDILKGLVEDGQYDNLLALADILYIPGVSTEAEREQLLEKSGAYDVLKNTGLDVIEAYNITDDEIEAVQQAAIWYFTNYEEDGEYDKYPKEDGTNTGWIWYTTDGNTYKNLSSYNPTGTMPSASAGGFRQKQMEALYKYLIDTAIGNAKNGINDENTVLTVYVSANNTEGQPIMAITKLPKEQISITVKKEWNDDNNQDGVRPSNVTVQLYKNGTSMGENYKVTLPVEGNWEYEWTELDKKESGKDITYTVKELNKSGTAVENNTAYDSNYTATYSVSGNTTTITNTHTPEETSVKVVKTWNDTNNQDGVRPESVTVQLYKNGKSMGESYKVELPSSGNWEYEWTGLDKKESGKDITYTVKELNKSGTAVENNAKYDDNYTATYSVSGNTTTITNTHTPEKTSVKVIKTWNDANNQDGVRPENVVVQLYKNGTSMGNSYKVTLPSSGKWEYEWTGLDKKESGKDITYTVKELNASGTAIENNAKYDDNYTATYSVSGNTTTITNTHTPEKTSVKVIKTWNDANNQDGVRPENVVVQLYKNGTSMGNSYKVTLPSSGKWEYEWTGLDKKESGKDITYTVKELNKSGTAVENNAKYDDNYTATYSVSGNTTTITNTHTPEKTSVKVIKTWNDANNQDGVRPENVVVQLYKNGTSMGNSYKVTLPSSGKWEYEWTGLDKKESGKDITYTVKELNASGTAIENNAKYDDNYTATYSVSGNTTTITNTHTPEETSITVNKVWIDNDNNELHQEIEVELYANDEATGQKVTLNEGNNWTAGFNNLSLKENGVEIKYTVRENTVVEGYEEPVITQDGNNFTITNTRIKDFDLALRKYITAVGDNTLEGTDSRVPNIDTSSLEGGTTATYKHKKDPVEVATGDELIYNITIYNEGEKEGRATKVVDQLPSGIEFVEVVSGNFEVLDGNYNTDTNTITLTRVTNNNDNLAGYTGEGELAEETIQIKCRVTAEAGATDKVLTNLAWISEEVDGVTGETITTEEGKDRDSEPSTIETQNKDQLVTEDEGYTGNESNQDKELTDSEEYFEGQQDDDDFEKVVIRKAEGTYNIQLIKTDNTEEAKRLEGAEFEITFADGSKLEKQRTNSNGMLELSGIQITEEGTDIITIKETQAPEGYNKLIDEIQVEITKGIVDGNYVITGAQVVNGQENENITVSANNTVVSVTIENEEQIFDLALRKYITVVGDNTLEGTDSRVPNIDTSTLNPSSSANAGGEGETTAIYKHKKDPVEVATGDEITYNLTIYNEGEKEGRATKVVDQLPSGLEFVEVVSGNFEVLEGNYDIEANTITLTRVTNNNDNLAGYTGEGELSEETIQIKCRVTAEVGATDKVLTN